MLIFVSAPNIRPEITGTHFLEYKEPVNLKSEVGIPCKSADTFLFRRLRIAPKSFKTRFLVLKRCGANLYEFRRFQTTYQDETCPSYDLLSLQVKIGQDTITWTKSGATFSFQKCVGDWKMFHRTSPEVTVCMQPILTPTLFNITQSKEFCESIPR